MKSTFGILLVGLSLRCLADTYTWVVLADIHLRLRGVKTSFVIDPADFQRPSVLAR